MPDDAERLPAGQPGAAEDETSTRQEADPDSDGSKAARQSEAAGCGFLGTCDGKWHLQDENGELLDPVAACPAAGEAGGATGTGTRSELGTGDRPEPPEERWVRLTPASQVTMDRPRWVWENRIPLGGTSLMAGDGGVGKTALTCWSAARLSRGELPGNWFGRPADVLYVGLEDDRATVTVPRLVAAGADLDRFLFVDIPWGATFSVGVDLAALLSAVREREIDVALVVLDPLDSHLTGTDTHRKAEVQAAIGRLAVLAQELRCGALGLGHLTKDETRNFVGRVNGSVAFTTGPRSVLGVGKLPQHPGERACALTKTNWADENEVPAIRFRIEKASVPHPDAGEKPIGTAGVVILGDDADITIEDLARQDDIDRACPFDEWLGPMLADAGPMRNTEVEKYALANGLGDRGVVWRARRRLEKAGLVVVEPIPNGGDGRPVAWSLTPQGFARWGGARTSARTPAREPSAPAEQVRRAEAPGVRALPAERANPTRSVVVPISSSPMTTAEVAERLDITPRRVRQLADEGEFGRQVDGRWLFEAAEIDPYLDDRQQAPDRHPASQWPDAAGLARRREAGLQLPRRRRRHRTSQAPNG